MDLAEESKKLTSLYATFVEELEQQRHEIEEDLKRAQEAYRIAATQGDFSENAGMDAARDAISKYTQNLIDNGIMLNRVSAERDEDYQHIGYVVLYTTVLLEDLQTGEETVYKLFPAGVSDLERGILARDSVVGKLLWLKRKGDVIQVTHRVTREILKYKVKDLF